MYIITFVKVFTDGGRALERVITNDEIDFDALLPNGQLDIDVPYVAVFKSQREGLKSTLYVDKNALRITVPYQGRENDVLYIDKLSHGHFYEKYCNPDEENLVGDDRNKSVYLEPQFQDATGRGVEVRTWLH